MPLTIKPPRRPSEVHSSSQSQAPSFPFSASPIARTSSSPKASSPVAPEYSPITPKVQPILPATILAANGATTAVLSNSSEHTSHDDGTIAESAQYIPEPPPQPFSSEDSTDAIALRAAISALQFQKRKAQDDLKSLDKLRRQALDEPEYFQAELAAGRLHEQKPRFGGLQAILDQAESDEEDEDEDMVRRASIDSKREGSAGGTAESTTTPAEVPDSQPSRPPTSSSAHLSTPQPERPLDFSAIPGPQDVVRMPYINWDKYHVVGESLDAMHEQQRRWPGNFAYGQNKGREFAVAAPYSPWLDSLDGQPSWEGTGSRKDSVATPSTLATPTATVSEHPMETRRSSKYQ